jgi:hypothetical protein
MTIQGKGKTKDPSKRHVLFKKRYGGDVHLGKW